MKLFEKLKEKYNINKLAMEEADTLNVMSNVNEKANKIVVNIAMVCLVSTIIYIITAYATIYHETIDMILLYLSLFFSLSAIFVGKLVKDSYQPKKYILLTLLLILSFIYSTIYCYVGSCCLILFVVLTISYFNPKITIAYTILSEFIYIGSIVLYSYLNFKYDVLFIRLLSLSTNDITQLGTKAIITVENTDFTSFGGYLQNQLSVYVYGFSIGLICIGIISVLCTINGRKMVLEESEIMSAKSKIELENNETKTKIMISQIQPHFIYNTLNSIYYLCEKEPLIAQKALGEFSDYLRENLNLNSSKEVVPFEHELKHIEKYLSLEKMRFEEELNIEYDIQCTCFKVPSLSLQPLVENAVKHGVGKKTGGGTVKIISKETYEYYEVIIQDDGVGFDVNKPFSTDRVHIGIDNTKGRLEKMIGAHLIIESQIGVGTTMTIKIPKENYYEDTSR